jgi:outer membrane protein OmpA-like peptidoglycan-associated protein
VVQRKHTYAIASTALLLVVLVLAMGTASAQNSFTSQAPEFSQNVKAVLFPFNVYDRVENPDVLNADADWLKQHPDASLWIQGRADSRGDVVYNLALSYRRAQFIKQSLLKSGVNSSQIGFTTGWGKLYPVCDAQDESCWQDNRRADLVQPGHAL